MEDDEAALDEWRKRVRGVERRNRRRRLLPESFPIPGVERRDDAGHANRVQLPIRKDRRRFRAFAVRRRCGIHFEWSGIARSPQDLSRFRIERRHHFVVALTREHVQAVPDHQRAGVAEADVDLPLAIQLGRPRRWLREGRRHAITVRAAPLRPIRRSILGFDDGREPRHDQHAYHDAAIAGHL